MSDTANAAMWRQHLDAALARSGETIILASLDGKGGMVMQAATTRPMDFVNAARSLLEQAMERTQEELAADGDDQGDDAREQLVSTIDEILGMLPDPHADD